MSLFLNFLLTILVELPIIALFFKRKKRSMALVMGLLINIISWAVAKIIFFSSDLNMDYVAIFLAVAEAIAFYKLMECNWKKAIILSLIVNGLSFLAVKYIPVDSLLAKPNAIRTTYYHENPVR